jgi:hypothetical protein
MAITAAAIGVMAAALQELRVLTLTAGSSCRGC